MMQKSASFLARLDAEKDISNLRRSNLIVLSNEIINQNQSSQNDVSVNNNKGETETKMKNIYKRKDGRWAGVKHINKQTVTVYAKTQKECLAKLQKALKHIQDKQSIPTTYTFDKFAIYWYETFKKNNICKSSQQNYENYIYQHLNKINCLLKDLNSIVLQEYINTLPPTRSKEYCTMIIKQVTKKAFELDLIKKDYGQFLQKGKINRTKISSFTLKEQKIILNNLGDDEFSIAIYTLLLTGCRPNELNTIKKSNIKKNMILIEGTKTKNAKRWIKISDWLQNKLLAMPGENILKRWTYNALKKPFKQFMQKCKIEGSLYQLRHTFATNLFYLGVPDKERQSYMGHYSSILTNDVYTDFDPTISKNDILNLYINLLPKFD